MRIFRILLCIALLAALLLAPPFLMRMARRDFFADIYRIEAPKTVGTVTIYHIVSARTYAGSLTTWLQLQAERYEKKHKGVRFVIEGMTEPYYLERVEYGRLPDAYSFFSGALTEDALQPIGMTVDGLREGIQNTDYAVPYCFSGYAALTASQEKVPMPEANPLAARMAARNGIETQGVVCDLRAIGDRLRDTSYGGSYAVSAVGNFTDQVCWLGIARDTSAEKAEALRGFFAFLCTESRQRTLGQLGAFPATNVEAEGLSPELKPIAEAYRTVQTVDPFAYAGARDAVAADAAAADAGDAEADARLQARMVQILWK